MAAEACETTELTVYWIEEEGWTGKISGSLYAMFKNKTLCDTTLISADKQRIACHSSVLAASSPYLQNILKTAIKNFHKVNLQVNINFGILKQVVDFIYMGRAAIASFQAHDLLDAAKQLDIEALSNACNRCVVGMVEPPAEAEVAIAELNEVSGAVSTALSGNINHEGATEEQVVDMVNPDGGVEEEEVAMANTERGAEEERFDAGVGEVLNDEQENSSTSFVMYEWNPENGTGHTKEMGAELEMQTLEAQRQVASKILVKPLKPTGSIEVQRPYVCGTCQRAFTQQSHLQQHERLHTGERPYVCKTCNKRFAISSNLNRHLKIHTGERPYVCNICQRAFNQSSHLKQHEQSHLGTKPFQCPQCQRYFAKSSHLVRHQKIHAGQKPYKCSTCPRAYSDRIHLIEHTRIHTGERPHMCQYCDKTFCFKTSLIQHTRLHTGEKPYGCDMCDARFPRKQSLKDHQKSHSNLREYVCIVCSAAFVKKKQLEVHMDTHILEDQKDHFDCDVCGKRFRRKESLLNHRKKMHSMLVREEASADIENDEPPLLHASQIKKERVEEIVLADTEETLHTNSMNSAAEILTSLAKGTTRDLQTKSETSLVKQVTAKKKMIVTSPASIGRQISTIQTGGEELVEVHSQVDQVNSLVQLPVVSDEAVHSQVPHQQLDGQDITHQVQQDLVELEGGTESGHIQVLQMSEEQDIPEVLQQVMQGHQHLTMVTEDGQGGQVLTEVTDAASLQAQILQQVELGQAGQQHEFEVLVVESMMDTAPVADHQAE